MRNYTPTYIALKDKDTYVPLSIVNSFLLKSDILLQQRKPLKSHKPLLQPSLLHNNDRI